VLAGLSAPITASYVERKQKELKKMLDMQQEVQKLIDSHTQPLINAGQAVIDAWESGDLAAAVRELGAALKTAQGQL
jgi:hypothetical protein